MYITKIFINVFRNDKVCLNNQNRQILNTIIKQARAYSCANAPMNFPFFLKKKEKILSRYNIALRVHTS